MSDDAKFMKFTEVAHKLRSFGFPGQTEVPSDTHVRILCVMTAILDHLKKKDKPPEEHESHPISFGMYGVVNAHKDDSIRWALSEFPEEAEGCPFEIKWQLARRVDVTEPWHGRLYTLRMASRLINALRYMLDDWASEKEWDGIEQRFMKWKKRIQYLRRKKAKKGDGNANP
jgi:hypothetical protein